MTISWQCVACWSRFLWHICCDLLQAFGRMALWVLGSSRVATCSLLTKLSPHGTFPPRVGFCIFWHVVAFRACWVALVVRGLLGGLPPPLAFTLMPSGIYPHAGTMLDR